MASDLRRKITYLSKPYTGVFRVEGSCGHYVRSDAKNVQRWIEDNSVGVLREGENLIFDGAVLCCLREEMTNTQPPCPAHSDFIYQMRLEVVVSPRGKPIPEGLVNAIRADGYEQGEEK